MKNSLQNVKRQLALPTPQADVSSNLFAFLDEVFRHIPRPPSAPLGGLTTVSVWHVLGACTKRDESRRELYGMYCSACLFQYLVSENAPSTGKYPTNLAEAREAAWAAGWRINLGWQCPACCQRWK